MKRRVKLTLSALALVALAFLPFLEFGYNDWDEEYQLSTTERDLAFESAAGFSPADALYILQLTVEHQEVSVFVVSDSRTAVYGICRTANFGNGDMRSYFHPQNEFKIVYLRDGLSWVNMRKPFALGLPRTAR